MFGEGRQHCFIIKLGIRSDEKSSNEMQFDIYELWKRNKVPSCKNWGIQSFFRTNKNIVCKTPRTKHFELIYDHESMTRSDKNESNKILEIPISQPSVMSGSCINSCILIAFHCHKNIFLIFTSEQLYRRNVQLLYELSKMLTYLFLIFCTSCPVINSWCDQTSW